jgi:hypothetical protein
VAKSPSRSGQVGNSFTWLFVIIAGSAFLILFYQVIQAQLTDANTAQAEQRLSQATDTLNSLYTSTNTNQSLPGFQNPYDVICEDNTAHLSPPDSPATQQLTQFPIYAPESLPTTGLNAVAVQYNAPIPITTILYLIPRDTTIPYDTTGQSNEPPRPLQPYLEPSTDVTTEPPITDRMHPVNQIGFALNNTELTTCTVQHIRRQALLAYQTLRHKAQRLNQTTEEDCQEIYTDANQTITEIINKYRASEPDLPASQGDMTQILNDLQDANDALTTNSCPRLY